MEPQAPSIALVEGAEGLGDAFEIRFEVFVGEQGVPEEIEIDDLDDVADHFVARSGDVALGTVRLLTRTREGVGVLGRLAVRGPARGTGLGAALVRAVEDHARRAGLTAIELHAQTHAAGFYARLGYSTFCAVHGRPGEAGFAECSCAGPGEYGPEEMEAGIPHVWMRREL
ncbi:GNAT family N-acetyltransferase [Actinocorallia aurea]